jgi:VanZ family protein
LRFFLRYWVPVVAYVLVVWGISLFGNIPLAAKVARYDKLIHAAEYLFLALLATRAVQASIRRRWLGVTTSFLMVGCTASLDEALQRFNPTRTSDLKDLAADLAGALAGIFLYYVLLALAGKGRKPVQDSISSSTSSRR